MFGTLPCTPGQFHAARLLGGGITRKEAKAYKKRIVLLLVKKWERPYSEMVGYVRGRTSILIIRSNLMILCEARSKKWFIPELEDMAAYKAVRERNTQW